MVTDAGSMPQLAVENEGLPRVTMKLKLEVSVPVNDEPSISTVDKR